MNSFPGNLAGTEALDWTFVASNDFWSSQIPEKKKKQNDSREHRKGWA